MTYKPPPLPERKPGQTTTEWYDEICKYRDKLATRLVKSIQGKPETEIYGRTVQEWQDKYQ